MESDATTTKLEERKELEDAAGDTGATSTPGDADAAGSESAGPVDFSEEQLHVFAGHQKGNYPLYADDKPAGGINYEYLDHTADVQLHSWGPTLKDSFESVVQAMFDYMTDIRCVESTINHEVSVEGDDMKSLLFNFLDEWLFVFSAEPFFIPREVKITEFDPKKFKIQSTGIGEYFDLVKHPQGTEVKAITYSNMQIHEDKDTNDIYVIIDI
nr:protein archease-like [Lytechinus pictus]